jgi:hypothetical protein
VVAVVELAKDMHTLSQQENDYKYIK